MASRASTVCVCEGKNRTLQLPRCDAVVVRDLIMQIEELSKVWGWRCCTPSPSVRQPVPWLVVWLARCKTLLFIILFSPQLDINRTFASQDPDCRVLRREYVNHIGIMQNKT